MTLSSFTRIIRYFYHQKTQKGQNEISNEVKQQTSQTKERKKDEDLIYQFHKK